MYLLAPFILQIFLKKILELIPSYEDKHQNGPKWPICLEQIFFGANVVITFIYLLAIFIVQNLKEFLQRIQNYDDAPFLGPKWSIFPKQFFFGKLLHHSHVPISPIHCAKF